MVHVQSRDDADVKTGDNRTLPARMALARILKDSAFVTSLPIAQRLNPCSLTMAALAGVSLSLLHLCMHVKERRSYVIPAVFCVAA